MEVTKVTAEGEEGGFYDGWELPGIWKFGAWIGVFHSKLAKTFWDSHLSSQMRKKMT